MSIKNELYSTHYDVYILYESPMKRNKSRNVMFRCLKKYKNKCIEFNRLLFLFEKVDRGTILHLCALGATEGR